jgi:hypothetical protein
MSTKTKEKVESLDQYLLNCGIDLTHEKPTLLKNEESIALASTAWQKEEKGIRAVLESRAMELRHKILFEIQAFELPVYRERLLEIAAVIKLFKDSVPAAERLTKMKDKERDDAIDASTTDSEEEVEEAEDNSSM